MVDSPHNLQLPSEIRRLLAGLRWRIRGYVWIQGCALALVAVGLTFWASLAVDYLPVTMGAHEMPRGVRAVLLAFTGLVVAWVLYRWVLARTFVPLADRSMAILLERKHCQLRDSLITSVELVGCGDRTSELQRQLLRETEQAALSRLSEVRPARVLNWAPLWTSVVSAAAVLATIGLLVAVNSRAFAIGVQRLYLLQDRLWPRQAHIEVVGVEIARSAAIAPSSLPSLIRFQDRRVKVAKGSNVRLIVQADASLPVVPEVCTIHYRTQDGDRGRVNMTRIGRIRDGRQMYQYEGKPLKGILDNVTFDVVGYDHRLEQQLMEAVESPAVVDCRLECVFPSYMVDAALSLWSPRTVPLTGGTQLPVGTQITLRGAANKELRAVEVSKLDSGESQQRNVAAGLHRRHGFTRSILPRQRGFTYRIPRLERDTSLDITLFDCDGIVSERPHRVYIAAVTDQPPVVDVVMRGISTAVTPDVCIPLRGRITDDYALARSWFEFSVNEGPSREYPFTVSPSGDVDAKLDFRELRSREKELAIRPQDKLNLAVKATDRCNLGTTPGLGTGDHNQLEVVTPDQLLALLEGREIGLRRRFEQIVSETTETRDMLLRVKSEEPGKLQPIEPEEAGSAGDAGETGPKRALALRLLRTQQAVLQSQKLAQEVLGVATSFHEICEELVANRLDTEDRKQRLQQRIAQPLERIAKELFPEFDRRLERLEVTLGGDSQPTVRGAADDPRVAEAAAAAIQQAQEILAEMAQVLQDMLDLETYNELLDIVRSLVADQQQLADETKQQQKKQILELLQ